MTDVGSVKSAPLRELAGRVDAAALARYVGSHPMAGSERSGPLAASAALFDGRPWAVTPHAGSDPAAVALVVALAEICRSTVVELAPEEHDRAVARTSHLPHLLAVLVAGRLAEAPEAHLALSGQGVRDVTRVAGSDPLLWEQIVAANAVAVLELLGEVRGELDELISAVSTGERDALHALLTRGVAGTLAIPGKHGGPVRATESVFVSIPDHPGELARHLRRRRRCRGQHRGHPDRPRPRSRDRSSRAGRRRGLRSPPGLVARGAWLGDARLRVRPCCVDRTSSRARDVAMQAPAQAPRPPRESRGGVTDG